MRRLIFFISFFTAVWLVPYNSLASFLHPNSENYSFNNIPQLSASFISPIQQRLINFVYTMIDSMHYTTYRLGGRHFDSMHGVYIVDCSAYVDYILKAIYPSAFLTLVDSSRAAIPTSEHFYNFFTRLTTQHTPYWTKINEVTELRAGDILVFRDKVPPRHAAAGHMMIVMNPASPLKNNTFLVRVSDSASAAHSGDTRVRHTSGIGIGTMELKVNPQTGSPYAYAWNTGGRYKDNIKFAMARPTNHPTHSKPPIFN